MFSAIYSYILNDDVSLDDEIQKYKKLLELDTYLYQEYSYFASYSY